MISTAMLTAISSGVRLCIGSPIRAWVRSSRSEGRQALKVSFDIGEASPRTVISGIAQHFTPEQVVGQQVVLVADLEPRKMRGVESQGMVLRTEDAEGKLLYVRTSEVMAGGSTVR